MNSSEMDIDRQNKHKSPRKPNENSKPTNEIRPSVKTKKPPVPVLNNQKPSLNRKSAGTNWSSFLAAINAAEGPITFSEAVQKSTPAAAEAPAKKSRNRRRKDERLEIVAMDCEMVGTGHMGNDDMLARVSIVRKNGEVLLDKFVKPREPVIDYRTSVSGIRAQDIERGEPFDKVQDEVIALLQGKILVGHAIYNDLAVLHIKHPNMHIRDTARYKPLSRLVSNGRTPSLKRLSQAILGMEIQTGEHNSVEDARAAMSIYNRLSADWEKYIEKKRRSNMMYK